jgi:hypothetical protein
VLKKAIRFATYDWTRELPLSLRVVTMIGMGIQGYAIWAALTRSRFNEDDVTVLLVKRKKPA